ncbi:MAG: ferrous iron transport protein A [Deltaproteobacteria bacterium]|nr:ferrous iron transport protein A [Deltaproteobacteria bacterium]
MNALTLIDLKLGQEAHIVALKNNVSGIPEKLIAMGVLPGKKIALVKSFPAYVFQIGHSQFSVDKDIAHSIVIKTS